MTYKPFHISAVNKDDSMTKNVLSSDEGRLCIRVGKVDICIKQSEDGQGIIIDAFDISEEGLLDPMETMSVWYDDLNEPDVNTPFFKGINARQ